MSAEAQTREQACDQARQRALNIKKSQETAQSNLPPNTLHIALYIRSDPPKANDCHWAFYLHTPNTTPSIPATSAATNNATRDANANVAGNPIKPSATASVSSGSSKHDIENPGHGWIAQHAPTANIFKMSFLNVVVHIANIAPENVDAVRRMMRERDHDVNQIEGVTCRVWLLILLGRLIEEGLVESKGGVGELEEECLALGNQFMDEAARNVQPRPVVRSRVCLG